MYTLMHARTGRRSRAHARTGRTHTHAHACTRTHTSTRTHARTHTHAQVAGSPDLYPLLVELTYTMHITHK